MAKVNVVQHFKLLMVVKSLKIILTEKQQNINPVKAWTPIFGFVLLYLVEMTPIKVMLKTLWTRGTSTSICEWWWWVVIGGWSDFQALNHLSRSLSYYELMCHFVHNGL